VQRIKTGAARLALGYEAERPGALRVIPVGLNFDARKSFRGRVLVSFGPAIPVPPYLDAYRQDLISLQKLQELMAMIDVKPDQLRQLLVKAKLLKKAAA